MILLKDHFTTYMNECQFVRRLRPATLRTSQEAFNHFLTILPEISYAEEVTRDMLTVFFTRLQTRERMVGKERRIGVKDSTLLSYANRLKTFFTWLTQRSHLSANPFDHLKLPRPVFVDHRALTGEEIKRIMGAIAQHAHTPFLLKRDMALVGILTFCGLRRNELLSLELRDIDLYAGFITVRPETSKSKKLRKIPINIHLRMHLSEYLQERKKQGSTTPFLFVSNQGNRLTMHGLKHWVTRLTRFSGVKFHIHRFRHTFATNLALQNVGAIKIQNLMGHADLKMTQTYLRSISTETMKEEINKLSFETLA